jgi:hypothetical protein
MTLRVLLPPSGTPLLNFPFSKTKDKLGSGEKAKGWFNGMTVRDFLSGVRAMLVGSGTVDLPPSRT